MVNLRKKTNRLAKKLMLAVIVSSTLITIITTSYQLYGLYSRDISAIDSRLKEIEAVHVNSISNVVWNSDYEQLELRVESMIHLPDMLYVEVREHDRSRIKAGSFHNENIIQRNFDLNYFYRGESRTIGKMIVQFDLASVYERLWDQLVDILISNFIKTFFISFIILWIFFRLVTRHIQELSDHATNLTTNNLKKRFVFKHKHVDENKVDELDVLSDAFNEMKNNLSDNIFELEQSRLEMTEREQFYGSILDMSVAIIYVKDRSGKFIFINRECENVFGLIRSNLGQKTAHDVFDINTAGEQIRNDMAVLKSRVPIEFEEKLTIKDKQHFYLSIKFPLYNEKNEIYAVGCVSTDVTSLKDARDLLEKKTLEQEEILNNLIDGVITINEDMRIGVVNNAAENILGYREREICGQDISVLMRDEDKPKFDTLKNSLIQIISERYIGTNNEFYARRKNGEVFPLQLSVNRLPDDINGSKRFIVSFIDLKDIKEKESLLRQSMKLEALGKLTGGIAHDYNNMLGVVLGYAELIGMKNTDDEQMKEYVYQIIHACQRGTKLSKKLLSFSSYKGMDSTCIQLDQLVREMRDMMQKTLTVRIKLDIHMEDNIWPIFVDQGELEDCLLNMCINAMHAMPDGGDLIIEVNNITIGLVEAGILNLEAGDFVRMSVIDNGCGMSDETQARIFDPFFTTKGSKGSGLGLSQVYGFMKRSKGSIQVKSSLGDGTRFVLYFPRNITDPMQLDNNEIIEADSPVHGNETILVVEDEAALRALNVNLFEDQGYQVYSAANGVEALAVLEKEDITLVVSDLLMPEMDGYKLSQYIREHYPDVKIQLLSGFNDEKFQDQLSEELYASILQKPVATKSLLQRVRQLLDT